MKLVTFKNCILVKGANRSVICDLQRHEIKLIPNSLYEILKTHENKSIYEIKEHYDIKDSDTIDEYIDFLIKNEYAFFDNNPELFPDLSLEWDHYAQITNAIIDFRDNQHKFEDVLKELNDLGCLSVQFRFFKVIKINSIKSFLDYVSKMKFKLLCIELIIPSSIETSEEALSEIMYNYSRLLRITVTNSNENKLIPSKINSQASLFFTIQKISTIKNCGIISKDYFTVNMSSFTESHHHNSCLNRKISIDVNGDIKNCPSMPESYGNIKDTTLEEAINKPGFKKYWNITKDDIEVCRDCEFRYICTDCRAYTERTKFSDEGLDLSKPLKCGYNPYTNEWAVWSTNPLKEKAIEYYGMKEIIENDKK